MKLRKFFSAAIIAAMIMTVFGTEFTYAAALKKPAQVKGVNATAESGTKITVKWNKVSKNVKGYTVYRNGKTVARVGKSQTSYTDAGLTPNTSYSYTVKAYNTQTKYYNSKTKKWVTKKPKKSQWKGKKSKKSYKYSKASAAVAVKTKKASSGGSETGESWTTTDYLGMSWQMRRDSNGKDYIAYEIKNGQVSASGRVVKAEDYPRYDKTANGVFQAGASRYTQKNGITFTDAKLSYGPQAYYIHPTVNCNISVYNADASKIVMTCENPVETYRSAAYADSDSSSLYYYDRKAVIGENGRYAVSFEPSTAMIAETKKPNDRYSYVAVEHLMTKMFDSVNLVYSLKYDGVEIGRWTLRVEDDASQDRYYQIGKAAVDHFRNGGSAKGEDFSYELSAEKYTQIRTQKGDYKADMCAIRAYVNEHYPYSEIDCVYGVRIYEAYSARAYGVYGYAHHPYSYNFNHQGFVVLDKDGNGIQTKDGEYVGLLETQGHK